MNSFFSTRQDDFPTFRRWYRTYMPAGARAWMDGVWMRSLPARRVLAGIIMAPVGFSIAQRAFGAAEIAEFHASATRVGLSGEGWRLLQVEVVVSGVLIVAAALHSIFRARRKNPVWLWAFAVEAVVSYASRTGTRIDPLHLDAFLFWALTVIGGIFGSIWLLLGLFGKAYDLAAPENSAG